MPPPVFNPSQPFQVEAAGPPPFDPNAPHQVEGAPTAPIAVTPNSSPPDKYHADAINFINMMKEHGAPVEQGYADRIAHGATFGFSDELLAGAMTPLEMIKRGTTDPTEAYKYAKAYQDVLREDAQKRQGTLGNIAEIAGSVGSGGGLASKGVTLAKEGMNFVPRVTATAAEGAGYGALSGAGEGNSLDERGTNALHGAALGAAFGAALPAASSVVRPVVSPIINNVMARTNPAGMAQSQLARALTESNQTPQAISAELQRAAAEGQPQFTLADALGNPGQRALAGAVRQPGPGRTTAVDFLEQRQAGQGRRIANALTEGFQAPQTADQTVAALTSARKSASDIAYEAARQNAGPVDLAPAIAEIDATLKPGVNQIAQSGLANDGIESALTGIRNKLTDNRSILSDFTATQRVRGELADSISSAIQSGQNNKARILSGVLGKIDQQMESASQGYRAANAQHAANSRVIDAVDLGKHAAMRGRTEDTIPAFQSMTPQEQAAFRAGYVDPHIAQTQGAAFGVNKARPFTSDAFTAEAATMAPGNDAMMRRIGRENTMFETRRQATQGSQTAENLADQNALRERPSFILRLGKAGLTGNLRDIVSETSGKLSGSTPEVRQKLIESLLSRGQSVNNVVGAAVQRQRLMNALLSGARSGALAGGADAYQFK